MASKTEFRLLGCGQEKDPPKGLAEGRKYLRFGEYYAGETRWLVKITIYSANQEGQHLVDSERPGQALSSHIEFLTPEQLTARFSAFEVGVGDERKTITDLLTEGGFFEKPNLIH